MDPFVIGLLCMPALLILIGLGIPVYVAMGLVGFVGYVMISGWGAAVSMMGIIPFGELSRYTFSVVPLFILMGNFAFHAGMGQEIYRIARAWAGRLPGGLAIATTVGCALFGAISGSSIATAATIGRIAIPEMDKSGYQRSLSTACVASSGTIASLIPPSVMMALYGLITETSISKLLLAGILPGLLETVNYSTMIFLRAKWTNPAVAPRSPVVSWEERFSSLLNAPKILLASLAVIGGIYSGVFTPTEAGAAGAMVVLIISLATGKLDLKGVWLSMVDSARTFGMLVAVFIGAVVFSYQYGITRIPFIVGEWIAGLGIHSMAILVLILLMYFVLGCFMDTAAMLFLTLPIVYPVVEAQGWDPIWFGILVLTSCEIGMITPPFGITLFAVRATTNTDMMTLFRGVGPFIICNLIGLVLLIVFPQISLFLPSLMD